MSYKIYANDVERAALFSLPNMTTEEMIAREAARRVAWVVANWYRQDNGMDLHEHLPESLQRVLEEQAPD